MAKKQTSAKHLVVIICLLAFTLLASVYYIFSQNAEIQKTKRIFEIEKNAKVRELEMLQDEYNDFLEENEINKQEIVAAKLKLQKLLDSVKNIKPDYSLLYKLRTVKDHLTSKLEQLEQENIALKQQNQKLSNEKGLVDQKLENTLAVVNEEKEKNENLNKIITKAQRLAINTVNNKPIRVKKSGKVVASSSAKRVSSIEVCYEVSKNTIAKSGEKEFYIQVISPEDKVIGGRIFIQNDEGQYLNISKVSKFRYQNKSMKVCDYVTALADEDFTKGKYTVNIFEQTNLISTSQFELN